MINPWPPHIIRTDRDVYDYPWPPHIIIRTDETYMINPWPPHIIIRTDRDVFTSAFKRPANYSKESKLASKLVPIHMHTQNIPRTTAVKQP